MMNSRHNLSVAATVLLGGLALAIGLAMSASAAETTAKPEAVKIAKAEPGKYSMARSVKDTRDVKLNFFRDQSKTMEDKIPPMLLHCSGPDCYQPLGKFLVE